MKTFNYYDKIFNQEEYKKRQNYHNFTIVELRKRENTIRGKKEKLLIQMQ
jgi:hypothetical protein